MPPELVQPFSMCVCGAARAMSQQDNNHTVCCLQEERGRATPKGQNQASLQLAHVSSAGLATGTMAAMLAAEAAR